MATRKVLEEAEAIGGAQGQPMISAVVAVRTRTSPLQRVVSSIVRQEYTGHIEVLVVGEEDPGQVWSAPLPENRLVRPLSNRREPGQAGRRNTGLDAATGTLIAFCDELDEWFPEKIAKQVETWRKNPEAVGIGSGWVIEARQQVLRSMPGTTTFADVVTLREPVSWFSTYLWRTTDLLDRIGVLDEQIATDYGQELDLFLRATMTGTIRSAGEVLMLVHEPVVPRGPVAWQAEAEGLTDLLRKYPQFRSDRVATAQVAAQIAVAHAVTGARRRARRWSRYAVGSDRHQLRAYAALAVGCGLLPRPVLLYWAGSPLRRSSAGRGHRGVGGYEASGAR